MSGQCWSGEPKAACPMPEPAHLRPPLGGSGKFASGDVSSRLDRMGKIPHRSPSCRALLAKAGQRTGWMGRKVPRDSSPACSFKVSGSQCPRSSRLGFMSRQSFRFQCSDPHLVPCCARTHPHEFQSMIALRPAAKAAGCSAPTLLALVRCGAFCQRQSASKAVGRTARSCWRRERNLNTEPVR